MVMLRRPGAKCALLTGIGLAACTGAVPSPGTSVDPSADLPRQTVVAADAGTEEPKPLGGAFRQDRPAWIKRVEARSKTNAAGQSDVTVRSVQPIHDLSGETEAVFTQLHVNARAAEPAAVSNVGIGYRTLVQPDLLVGVNSFYDRDWTEINHRASADAELKWRALDFGFNYYVGLDDRDEIGGAAHALDGYNMEVATQVPFLPWARAQFSTSEFFMDAEETDGTSFATSMQLGLLHNLSISGGVRADGMNDEVGFIGVSYRIDGNPAPRQRRYLMSDDPIAPVAFESRNMKGHLYDKVHRIEAISRGQ